MKKANKESVTIKEMQAELKYAMPYHTSFVKGIIADWNMLIKNMDTNNRLVKVHNDLKKTIEALVFNSGAQSSIYESCDKYYRFNFEDMVVTFEKRIARLEELNSARKEYDLCKSAPHDLREILAALDNY